MQEDYRRISSPTFTHNAPDTSQHGNICWNKTSKKVYDQRGREEGGLGNRKEERVTGNQREHKEGREQGDREQERKQAR